MTFFMIIGPRPSCHMPTFNIFWPSCKNNTCFILMRRYAPTLLFFDMYSINFFLQTSNYKDLCTTRIIVMYGEQLSWLGHLVQYVPTFSGHGFKM